MNRPLLTPALSPEDFRAWYWLKKELQAFCSAQALPTSGSKEDLSGRVLAHLSGELMPTTHKANPSAPRSAMPQTLTPDTVIGPGWRLNEDLRAFFVAHTTSAFRFNQALRDLFKNPQGQTLAQAVAVYQTSLTQGPSPIKRQFQFNQHIRDYFEQHPGATRAHALQAWQHKRQTPDALVFSAHSECNP
jgi:hypothetical protein